MATAGKVTPKEAIAIAKGYGVSATLKTIHTWCDNNHIGIKVVGRWYINRKRLIWLLEGMEWKIKEEEQEKKRIQE